MSQFEKFDEPVFLRLEEVLEIHAYQVDHFGGDPAVLNMGLVESAIAQPRQMFAGNYLHPDLASMAAAYLYHLTLNHGFADGNKRTGVHAALVFLGLNGIDEIDWDMNEVEALSLGVASGQIRKEQVIAFFQKLLEDYQI